MKEIICVVAKTGRGKDTLAKRISAELDIPVLVSYTTRDMREDDIPDVSHYFVTDERMEDILKNENVIAYAKKKSGVQYCATLESIKADKTIYIVDPEGIDYLTANFKDKVKLFVVELWADDEVIEARIRERGDNWSTYEERKLNEMEEFNNFHNSSKWDISIDATMSRDAVFEAFKTTYLSR